MSEAPALHSDVPVPALDRLEITPAGSALDWAALDPDILSLILKRLELADSARFAAVCRSWRSSAASNRRHSGRKPQIPWLMLSSPSDPTSRFFYSLSERRTYKIHLPQIAGRHCIGSSEGFLVSIDDNAGLHLTNPITGAHHPLPPWSTLPNERPPVTVVVVGGGGGGHGGDRGGGLGEATHGLIHMPFTATPLIISMPAYRRSFFFHKAILSPSSSSSSCSSSTVFLVYHGAAKIAFGKPGDDTWTGMDASVQYYNDIVFHKGKLYAVNYMGTVAVFDPDRPLDPPFVFPPGLPYIKSGGSRRYLVESPEGKDLFLVYRDVVRNEDEEGLILSRSTDFTVFKLLDESDYSWGGIKDLGDLALFLGFNQSVSLSAKQFPDIRRNCIYFTNDFKEYYHHFTDTANSMGVDMGVFDLADGSIRPIDIGNVDLEQFDWPPAVWFTPLV